MIIYDSLSLKDKPEAQTDKRFGMGQQKGAGKQYTWQSNLESWTRKGPLWAALGATHRGLGCNQLQPKHEFFAFQWYLVAQERYAVCTAPFCLHRACPLGNLVQGRQTQP